jgi:DNA polymerase III delta subunit
LLAQAGKRMVADARQRLMQWTGFDLRTLCGNLEKLISFVGDRKTITERGCDRRVAAYPQGSHISRLPMRSPTGTCQPRCF